MKKRLIVSAGMVASLASAALLVLWLLPARPAVTKANFDRIEIGMTLSDVEAILGADRGRPVFIVYVHISQELEQWEGDEGIISIILDHQDHRVIRKVWHDSPLTIFERLQRRLPWLTL